MRNSLLRITTMDKKLIFLIFFLIASPAQSAVISYGSYSHDTDTNVVVGDGLEWLQWPLTKGMNYTQANNVKGSIYGGGWEIATPNQIAGLINNFNFGFFWDPENPTNESISTQIVGDYKSGPFYNFVSMFGYTYYGLEGNEFADWSKLGARAIFGPIEPGTDTANFVQVWSYGSISNVSCCNFQEMAGIDSYSNFSSDKYVGVALVRLSNTPPISSVPIPASLWLFGSGLIGLIGLARRKKA